MLNVLIALEKPLWRKGFQTVFHAKDSVRLWYINPTQANLSQFPAINCDVVVFGCSNDDMQSTLRTLSQFRKRYAQSGFVLMADDFGYWSIARFHHVGVSAFVDEHATNEQFLAAVLAAARNDLYISSRLARKLPSHTAPLIDELFEKSEVTVCDIGKLSEREMEILKLVARGMSNRSIAEELFISEKTVKNHLYSAYKKLGVRDRTQAAMAIVKSLLLFKNRPFGPT